MVARHEQDALLGPQPLRQFGGVDVEAVAHVADRAGVRGPVREKVRAVVEPAGDAGEVGPDDPPGPLEYAGAHIGAQDAACRDVRERGRRDRRVVFPAPELLVHVRRRRDPAESEPRKRVRLRKGVRHDHPVVAAPEALRLRVLDLRPHVDLVREDPGPGRLRRLDDLVHRGPGEDGSRRVVGVRDDDEARPGRDDVGGAARLGLPAEILPQLPRDDIRAEPPRDARRLAVGRLQRHHAISRRDEAPEDHVVRLGPARRGDDVVGDRPLVQRRDRGLEGIGTVALAVLQADVRRIQVDEVQEFGKGERMHAALGYVVVHAVLERRLPPLHQKWGDTHIGSCGLIGRARARILRLWRIPK